MLARSGLKPGHDRSSQPTTFLAINLKTAKAMRLEIPRLSSPAPTRGSNEPIRSGIFPNQVGTSALQRFISRIDLSPSSNPTLEKSKNDRAVNTKASKSWRWESVHTDTLAI